MGENRKKDNRPISKKEAAYKVKLPAMRDWLIEVARQRGKVTYQEVMDVFGVDRFSLRHAMDFLGHEADNLHEPIITALIVSKKTQRCSSGLVKEFGVHDDEAERGRLYNYWVSNHMEPAQAEVISTDLEVKAARFVSVEARPDQAAFRRQVYLACDGKCVISKCNVVKALDAAHKHGRDWRLGHNNAEDGYLLRKDLHALYDNKLLWINDDGKVELDSSVMEHYKQYAGVMVSRPPHSPLASLEELSPESKLSLHKLSKLPYAEIQHEIKKNRSDNPLFIYKYLSSEIDEDFLEDYFLNSYFWLSSPNDFNDPFDTTSYVTLGEEPEVLRDKYTELIKKNKPELSREARKKEVSAMMKNKEMLTVLRQSIKKHIEAIGVYCFSEDNLNLLMWSHYANLHKGFILQFDIAKDVENFLRIVKVDYSNEYPITDWSNMTNDSYANIFIKKHIGWSYEKERRFITRKGARKYLKFKPEAVTGIVFGCRTDNKFKKKIFEVLQKRAADNLGHINVSCAVMHNTEYKLTIEKDQYLNWPS